MGPQVDSKIRKTLRKFADDEEGRVKRSAFIWTETKNINIQTPVGLAETPAAKAHLLSSRVVLTVFVQYSKNPPALGL